MPGVTVVTSTRSGPTAPDQAPAGAFFVVGQAERGSSTKAGVALSFSEFVRDFGEQKTYTPAWDHVRTFYEEGGSKVYFARVVGASPTVGFLEFDDRAGVPEPTMRINAKGAGTWSSDVTVTITDGSAADSFTLQIDKVDEQPERYKNLRSVDEAVERVNPNSKWIQVVDLESPTAAPDNIPANVAADALSAGDDDRDTIDDDSYFDAMNTLLIYELGAGAIAIPGMIAEDSAAAIQQHCIDNRRIGLLAMPEGSSDADAKLVAQGLVDSSGEFIGLFHPWVEIPDSNSSRGGTVLISPEGYVAGVRCRTQLIEGPWRAPAGTIADARFVTGLETPINRASSDDLDDNEVSAIREIQGDIRLYGWQSLSDDEENYDLLIGRDMLNYITVLCEERLEQYVWRPIDSRGQLFKEVESELVGILDPIRLAGGLFERINQSTQEIIDPGYRVSVSASVNDLSTTVLNELHADVSVRISPAAATITIRITKVSTASAV